MIHGGTRGSVFCIDEVSGEEIWRTKLETGGFLNVASTGDVAVLVKGEVVVAGCNGHVWGLDARTGEVRWHNGLSGLGNSFVSLADQSRSIQYIHGETRNST